MKLFTTFTLFAFLLFSVTAVAERPEGEGKGDKAGLQKTTAEEYQVDFIDINNCLMWIATNGMTAHNPLTDASGFEWPKGSGQNAIFTDGIVWGGYLDGELHVGGATYRYGMQPGVILSPGEAANPTDPKYRIYKIRNMNQDDYDGLEETEQERLRRDFMEWPAAEGFPPVGDGAPWIDNNNNGIYEPNFEDYLANGDSSLSDIPWFIGDEVLWFVSNDLDPNKAGRVYGTEGVGLELQTMVWAYNQTGPLANIVFTKYTIINKNDNQPQYVFKDAYFSKWSDPDLGDAFDDFVGIDTALSLGYVYNGYAKDEVYNIPPAAGYDFFQGPIVPNFDPASDSTAIYNFKEIEGYKNLPVSTFAFYINGDNIYVDPSLGVPRGATMMYNYMKGLLWNGQSYVDPVSGLVVPITLAGNPVTRTGWIDGIIKAPGDRRFLMTAGPFDLAPGDTQEVVVATIVGQGGDRLSSIGVLKFYDKFAQNAFDNNFDLPQAPPSPTVLSSLQDREILLHWGDPTQTETIESFSNKGYKFQGYNVYQFPSESATLADAKRIATYDIDDGLGTIFDTQIDPASGVPVDLPIQFGTDSGLEHVIRIRNDAFKDRPLVNNQPYYFAVTSYSFNPEENIVPRQLESTPKIIEVRPQLPDPGIRYGVPYDANIPVKHTQGVSTGIVDVVAIDPMRLTGHTYEITFESLGKDTAYYNANLSDERIDSSGEASTDSLIYEETLIVDNAGAWTLTDLTTNEVKIKSSQNLDGLGKNAFVIDGFEIGVRGLGYYQQYTDTTHKEGEYYISNEILSRQWFGGPEIYEPYVGSSPTITYEWLPGYWSRFFAGNENPVEQNLGSAIKGYNVKKVVEIRLDQENPSKGYVYLRRAMAPPTPPRYEFVGYSETPMTVWDISDSLNPKQLQFAWVESSSHDDTNDKLWAPSTTGNARDDLYILDIPYSDTPVAEYTTPTFDFGQEAKNMPILYFGVYQLINNRIEQKYAWSDNSGWRIKPNVPFTVNDKYIFTTGKAEFTKENAVQDINEINVFPNPYLGANNQEVNKYQRFVTFNHLPSSGQVHFRIFTLSGTLVASFSKPNDGTQYASWDLQNDNGLPVGSGLYIIHIDMPDLGVEKVLKLGVVNETQYLDRI